MKKFMMKKLYATSVLLSLGSQVSFSADRVIFGDDNRKDVYQVMDQNLLDLVRSTALLTDLTRLTPRDQDTFSLSMWGYGTAMNLCPSEPFYHQTRGGHCSGFLIAPDVLVTAGHCVERISDCKNTAIIFGFEVSGPNDKGKDTFHKQDIYLCKEIIASTLVGDNDFSIIRLNRKTDRPSIPMNQGEKIQDGQSLVLIGHPSGLPTKIADGAVVKDNSKPTHFGASTDSYQGNSGSVVINADTSLVEGILVRGTQDFRTISENNVRCGTSNLVDESIANEGVTRISEIFKFLPTGLLNETIIKESGAIGEPIPDNDLKGLTHRFVVEDDREILHVKLTTDITHSYSGDIVIDIISPDGVRHQIKEISQDRRPDLKETLVIPRLTGISSKGEWQVIVSDVARGDFGLLNSLKLDIVLK